MAARGCDTPAESPPLLFLLLSAVQNKAEPGQREMEKKLDMIHFFSLN